MVWVPLREAKASFSELVARADLLGQVTVLTKHGRPAAAIVPAAVGADLAGARATVGQLWELLDRVCPRGQDSTVDDARTRIRSGAPAGLVIGPARVERLGR